MGLEVGASSLVVINGSSLAGAEDLVGKLRADLELSSRDVVGGIGRAEEASYGRSTIEDEYAIGEIFVSRNDKKFHGNYRRD